MDMETISQGVVNRFLWLYFEFSYCLSITKKNSYPNNNIEYSVIMPNKQEEFCRFSGYMAHNMIHLLSVADKRAILEKAFCFSYKKFISSSFDFDFCRFSLAKINLRPSLK